MNGVNYCLKNLDLSLRLRPGDRGNVDGQLFDRQPNRRSSCGVSPRFGPRVHGPGSLFEFRPEHPLLVEIDGELVAVVQVSCVDGQVRAKRLPLPKPVLTS